MNTAFTRTFSHGASFPSVFAVSPKPSLLPLIGAGSVASALPPAGRRRRHSSPAAGFSGVQLQLLLVFAESQHELLFIVQALCIVYLL